MTKKRLVIIGANSFIAKSVVAKFKNENFSIIKITRKKCDLIKKNSIRILSKVYKKNDIVFFAAAEAPVKNLRMFYNNLLMCKNVIESLKNKKLKLLIYLSSDAVYADSSKKLDEKSKTDPDNLHGLMHLCRESMLKKEFKNCLTIIRPTLVYGKNDPHNGYGPNKFSRLLKLNKKIKLFGKGEERRDHISIYDISNIIKKIITKNKKGIFNLATGKVISFMSIAKHLTNIHKKSNNIIFLKRNSPMPHNGYRAFNIKKIKNNGLIKKPKLISDIKNLF